MKKANFSIGQGSHFINQGSYVRSSVIRQSESISGFLRERAELRLSPFTAEEEERMANPRPRSQAERMLAGSGKIVQSQTERILRLCEGGIGLREAIAAT